MTSFCGGFSTSSASRIYLHPLLRRLPRQSAPWRTLRLASPMKDPRHLDNNTIHFVGLDVRVRQQVDAGARSLDALLNGPKSPTGRNDNGRSY
jgi:hypothetical protein